MNLIIVEGTKVEGTKNVTKGEAAQFLGLKDYDVALPQDWISHLEKQANDRDGILLSSIVWSYDKGSIFGFPYPLTIYAYEVLKKYGYLLDSVQYKVIKIVEKMEPNSECNEVERNQRLLRPI